MSSSQLIIRKALALTKSQQARHIPKKQSPQHKHFTISKKQISNEEATSVLDSRRSYFMASTINHALHPDILSSQGQVGGDHYLLCKLKAQADQKPEVEDGEEKKEEVREEEESSAQGRNVRARYFDTRVNAELICFHCKQAGHQARSCPNEYKSSITCSFCGLTDHLASQCPTKLVCYKCGQPGHKISQCKERGVQVCQKCGKGGHSQAICLLFMESTRGKAQRHLVRECIIEQNYQDYMVKDLEVDKILNVTQEEPSQGDPQSIQAFRFSQFNDELMTNLRRPQKPMKQQKNDTIMCPICSGCHDFRDCSNPDGNRTFERLYKQHPRFKDEGNYYQEDKSEDIGATLFQQIYTREYESPQRRGGFQKRNWKNEERKGHKNEQVNYFRVKEEGVQRQRRDEVRKHERVAFAASSKQSSEQEWKHRPQKGKRNAY